MTRAEFDLAYGRAREAQQHIKAEEMLEIADDPEIPADQKRIMVDTRKWQAERLNRKIYGNSVQHKHELDVRPDPLAPGGLPGALAFLDRRSRGDGDDGNPVDS